MSHSVNISIDHHLIKQFDLYNFDELSICYTVLAHQIIVGTPLQFQNVVDALTVDETVREGSKTEYD